MESITVRLGFTSGSCDQTRMQTQSAASSAATLPLLAINRKDTGANRRGGTGPGWSGFDISQRTGRKLVQSECQIQNSTKNLCLLAVL
jgi:hypothetical protein